MNTSTNCLPPEILQEIFIHSLPSKTFHPQRNRIVLSICLVSKSWNQLAHECPHLWTVFVIDRFGIESPTIWKTAARWFAHSGGLPLSLRITPGTGAFSSEDSQEMGTGILSRIKTLQCEPKFVRLFVYQIPSLDAMILEGNDDDEALDLVATYFLSSPSNIDSTGNVSSGSIGDVFPRLRKLSFEFSFAYTEYPDLITKTTIGVWSNLTHLITVISTLDIWVMITRTCSNLVCGMFEFDSEVASPRESFADVPTERAVLPNLVNLGTFFWKTVIGAVFELIQAPALRVFRIRADDQRWDGVELFNDNLLGVERLSITHLDAKTGTGYAGACDALLPLFPVLQEIDLQTRDREHPFCSPDLIDGITRHFSSLPNLQMVSINSLNFLEVKEPWTADFAVESLVRLFSRFPKLDQQTGLNGVYLYVPSPPEKFLSEAQEKYRSLPVKVVHIDPASEREYFTFQYRLGMEEGIWYDGMYY